MKYSIGDLVISTKQITEDACGDHPEFLLCEKGQRLKVTKSYPKEKYPKHGVDSYSVQDEKAIYSEFLMDETELEEPTLKQKYK